MARLLKSDPRRRASFKDVQSSILILCEGAKTEPQYLQSVKRALKLSALTIEGPRGVPKTLVEIAVDRLRSGAGYDAVWCVFDVDTHPNLDDARQQALAHGVHLAVSNPCIELWLVLHHKPFTRPCTKDQIQREMRSVQPGYEKSIDAEWYWSRYETARGHAVQLKTRHAKNGTEGEAPSTNFHILIDYLLQLRHQ